MNGQGDGVAPTIITSLDGSVAIRGGGAVDLSTSGAGVGTPFRLIPVPNANTSSLVPVDLLPVPGGVTVGSSAGNILLDFDASMQLTIPGGAGAIGTFQIVGVQFLWDGAPLADTAFAGIVPAQADLFNTIAYGVRVRSQIFNPTVGVHSLSVQWNVSDATCVANTFVNNGNLSIQTVF